MRHLNQARVGLRLARREAVRRPWRTALVLLLVIIPTAGMTAGATMFRTSEWTAADRRAATFGTADAVAQPRRYGIHNDLASLEAGLPAGSRVISGGNYDDRFRLPDRAANAQISDLPLDDPLLEGTFDLVDGRLVRAGDEVVIADSLARRLGVEVGDRLRPERRDQVLRVVGVIRPLGDPGISVGEGFAFASDIDAYVTSVGDLAARIEARIDLPGAPYRYLGGSGGPGEAVGSGDELTLAPSAPTVPGWSVNPAVVRSPPSKTDGVFYVYLAGAVGLLALGTVIAAAFAVGARQQLRTIGLLSSTGASPGAVRWFLVAQGFVVGLVGSVAGVALASLAFRQIPLHVLTKVANRPVSGPVTTAADIVPIVLIGTGAAMVAAWLPARSAARIPTLQALAGRRPLSAVPRRLPLLGAVALAVGCVLVALGVQGNNSVGGPGGDAWVLLSIAGVVAIVVGVLAVTPWVLSGAEKMSARAPASGRLAARSIGRSRARSSAVVAAICVVTASIIGITSVYESLRPRNLEATNFGDQLDNLGANQVALERYGAPVSDEVIARAAAILPEADIVPVPLLVTPGGEPAGVAVDPTGTATATFVRGRGDQARYLDWLPSVEGVALATPALLELFEVPEGLRRSLRQGGAVSVIPAPVDATGVRVTPPDQLSPPGQGSIVPLGGSFASPAAAYMLPGFLVSADTVADLGLVAKPSPTVLFSNDGPPTDQQRSDLELMVDDVAWASQIGRSEDAVQLFLPESGFRLDEDEVILAMTAVALLLLFAIITVGLALAAKDSEGEAQVLTALGAPPRTLRRVGALRPALLVLVAAVISIPAGLLPAAAVVTVGQEDYAGAPDQPFRVDLGTIALVLIAAPIVVALAALLVGWLRDTMRRPRPTTFEFAD